jgi:hypothetical protein
MELGPLKTKMIYLIFIITGLFFLKPTLAFKPDGTPREYGVGYDTQGYHKTFYTLQVLIIIIAAFLYAATF